MKRIACLTDFGLADGYPAAVKAVIWGICPTVQFLDVTHEVRPQAIDSGAYLLGTVYPYLPPATITLAVVDPGVGTDRPAIVLETPHGILVGPDNGLFSDVLAYHGAALGRPSSDSPAAPELAPLPAGCRAYHLTEPAFRLPVVSSTFHGRDIFGPAAGHLAAGRRPAEFGPASDRLRLFRGGARTEPDGTIVGRVRHIDRFGNAITSISHSDLAKPGQPVIRIGQLRLTGLVRTFGAVPVGTPIALIGSSGHLEIAVSQGSAAERFKINLSDPVRVTWEATP